MEMYLNGVLLHTQPLAPAKDNSYYNDQNDAKIKTIKDFLSKNLQIPLNRTISYINRA